MAPINGTSGFKLDVVRPTSVRPLQDQRLSLKTEGAAYVWIRVFLNQANDLLGVTPMVPMILMPH